MFRDESFFWRSSRWWRAAGTSEIRLKFVERARGRKIKFVSPFSTLSSSGKGMREGWIGGIPFSPSLSVTKVGRGISTEGDGDSKR